MKKQLYQQPQATIVELGLEQMFCASSKLNDAVINQLFYDDEEDIL
jgi:hypothetical protein